MIFGYEMEECNFAGYVIFVNWMSEFAFFIENKHNGYCY